MNYHDTHFHLDLCENPEKMSHEIENAEIYSIAVTNSPSVFHFTQRLCSSKKYIRPAIGLHPELAFERKYEVEQFISLLNSTKYVGEIGLDNLNKSKEDYKTQKDIFLKIARACADQGNKILTVHSRRAASDVIDIIGMQFPGKVILHWFSGSTKDLDKALKYGFYFSANYPMTVSTNGKKIISKVPLDRLLIESDGPFTSYGDQPCTPLTSSIVMENICGIFSETMNSEDVRKNVLGNFRSLLSG